MGDKRTKKAIAEGLRARSSYKLIELNDKYHFLDKANHVLDLGCWPGGWSVVATRYCSVTAVDLKPMEPIKNCEFIRGDLNDPELLEELPEADVVLSDAAPQTAGDSRDQYLSYLIGVRTLEIAVARLRENGTFVCKMFQGEDFDEFLAECKKHFKLVKTTKPVSSKKQSKEMYIVCREFKGF